MSEAASGVEEAEADAMGAAGASEGGGVLVLAAIGACSCEESGDDGAGVLGE